MLRGRFRRSLLFTTCVTSIAAVPAASATATTATTNKIPVAMFGDSIGYEAEPFFAARLEASGRFVVRDRTTAASAPCDWIWGLKAAPLVPQPAAVVVETLGVSLSNCQMDSSGNRPARDSAAYFAMYERHLRKFIDMFPKKTKIFMSSAPATSSGVGYASGARHAQLMMKMLASVAATRSNAKVVNAAASIQTSKGFFVRSMPCLAAFPCSDDPTPGHAVVRALDGIHFCPPYGPLGTSRYLRQCPVPDIGAMIFGSALAAPVLTAFPA